MKNSSCCILTDSPLHMYKWESSPKNLSTYILWIWDCLVCITLQYDIHTKLKRSYSAQNDLQSRMLHNIHA